VRLDKILVAGGDLAAGGADRLGRFANAAHHRGQPVLHGIEFTHHLADLVGPGRCRALRQVPVGDCLHRQARLLQSMAHLAQYLFERDQRNQASHRREHENPQRIAPRNRGHVIDIHARAEHPAPRLEAEHKRALGHGLGLSWLGPQVIDIAFAGLFDPLHELDEQRLAVGILVAIEVLAVEFRPDRMHDHARRHVVDPHVLLTRVTDRPDLRGRGCLGLRVAQALCGNAPVVALGDLMGVLDLLDGGLQTHLQQTVGLAQRRKHHQPEKGAGDDDQRQTQSRRKIQLVHRVVSSRARIAEAGSMKDPTCWETFCAGARRTIDRTP
jgi:hypothetical protein